MSNSGATQQEISDLIKNTSQFQLESMNFIQENLLSESKPFNDPFPSQINFDQDLIAVAPYGGSIAVLHSYQRTNEISLYDPCLNLITKISPNIYRKLIGLYLTPEELLVLVYDDAQTLIMSQRGDIIAQTSIQGSKSAQVKFCAFVH